MRHVLFTLLVAGWTCFGLAQGSSAIKFPSPDGRFALRVSDLKVDLIEATTGKVMVDLGPSDRNCSRASLHLDVVSLYYLQRSAISA